MCFVFVVVVFGERGGGCCFVVGFLFLWALCVKVQHSMLDQDLNVIYTKSAPLSHLLFIISIPQDRLQLAFCHYHCISI